MTDAEHIERLRELVCLPASGESIVWALATIEALQKGQYLPYPEMQDEANPDYYPLQKRLEDRLKVPACRACEWLPEDRNAVAWALNKVRYVAAADKTAAEMRALVDRQDKRIAELEGALKQMLDSAYPHPVEHPTMTKAWAIARKALEGSR